MKISVLRAKIEVVLWRFFSSLCDWRGWLVRGLQGKPTVDFFAISNFRGEVDRRNFVGSKNSACQYVHGPRFWVDGKVSGRLIAINVTARELTTSSGMEKARAMIVSACEMAEKRGVKVVLLAAGTKRLFGSNGEALKKKFPNIIFTIGDNGTALLLQKEVMRAIEKTGLPPTTRIVVLGPYGFLGESIVQFLLKNGFKVIGVGTNRNRLERISKEYGIEVHQEIGPHLGKVSLVVACTHSKRVRLTAEDISQIDWEKGKGMVVDVAEPSNLRKGEYLKCQDKVIRQDAGNGYSPELKYVLGKITYERSQLSDGVIFGCFAEGLAIAAALKTECGAGVNAVNWFELSNKSMKLIDEALFPLTGFTVPTPRCFGREIESFSLDGG